MGGPPTGGYAGPGMGGGAISGATGTWCVGIGAGGVGYPWCGGATNGVCGTGIGTVGAERIGSQGGMYGSAGTGGLIGEGVRGVTPCCRRYSRSWAVHS